jgi:hypothetical protein
MPINSNKLENYNTAKFCSNTLIGGGDLFSVGKVFPLVVKKGTKPRIWLKALINSEKNEFISIIEDSVSKQKLVTIEEPTENSIEIKVQNVKIIKISNYDNNSMEIEYLDLRPIGFNIQGTKEQLLIGSNSFSGNTMQGGGTLISLG